MCIDTGFVPFLKERNFFMSKKEKVYRCAMYLRLSKEDESVAETSNSIINQEKMIHMYIDNHDDLVFKKKYVDDGVSGSGFDRPGFNKMMEDVDEGKIDCIIVKDLSRFGRNHYECDRYMQMIFPQKGIRFIAITDHYDSNNETSETDMFLIPIKNIMNDNYCRDMSVKIRTQLETKRKLGECVKNFAPYGYIKNPEDKHKLIIDEYAAFVVKEIFYMKLKGYSINSIVDELNEMGIKSPSEYKKTQNSKYTATLQRNSIAKWCTTEVRNILSDMIYCGSMVQGRITKPTFKCKKSKPVEKDMWTVVDNTHEAIIELPHFKVVERLLELETRIPPSQKMVYPLSGMVRCGKCGGKMLRKVKGNKYGQYHYLICSNKLNKTCDMPMIPYNEAESVVLNALQFHIRSMLDVNYYLQNHDNSSITESINNILIMDINEKKNEIRAIESSLCFLHDKHLSGVLGDAEYSRLRKIKTAMLDEAEESLELLRRKHETSQTVSNGNNSWMDIFKEYQNICVLKREAVALFVKNIVFSSDKAVEINFIYQTELEELNKISDNLKSEQDSCSEAV